MFSSHYIDLVLFKAYADLRAEASKTYISFLWWIIDPLMYMVVFYIVFMYLLQKGTDDFATFLLVGLTFWKWFASSVTHALGTIMIHRGLIRQIYLPKFLFPLISVITDLVKFGLVLLMLLLFLLLQGHFVSWTWLLLPLLLLCQLLLVLGIASLLAAIAPILPDLRFFVESLLILMMFMSGIFYDAARIPAQYQDLYYMNPMAVMVDAFRSILMHARIPDWWDIFYVASIGALALGLSLLIFKYFDKKYPRMVFV